MEITSMTNPVTVQSLTVSYWSTEDRNSDLMTPGEAITFIM